MPIVSHDQSSTSPPVRLRSLDVFRGATIAGMMLVNNPGSWSHVYTAFNHTTWAGWTFADTIFPTFLWIVGVALVFSVRKRTEAGATRSQIVAHGAQRSLILIILGLFLSIFPIGVLFGQIIDFSGWRFPGILQRIALCSFAATLIIVSTKTRGRASWLVGLLALYWILITYVPVPGHGPGVLEPVGSLAWYIDSQVFGLRTWLWTWWRNPPSPGFDPEGLLSTLPAISTVLFGILSGEFLATRRDHAERTGWLFFAGTFLMLAGLIMEPWLPMIKGLWTSSFAIYMAGLSTFCFASFSWIVDVQHPPRWTRWLEIYGQNAIAMFFLAGVVERLTVVISWKDPHGSLVNLHDWFYRLFFASWISEPHAASFVHALFMMLAFFGVAYWMHKERWIVKI